MQLKLAIPSGTTARVDGAAVVVEAGGTALRRPFDAQNLAVRVDGSNVVIETVWKDTRPRVALAHALAAHLRNLFAGAATPHAKRMQIVYAHFPITLDVKPGEILVKNFLGEKNPRHAKIEGPTKVDVKGSEVVVSGPDKEAVGQTANNLYRATRAPGKDPRVFQDGVYYAIE